MRGGNRRSRSPILVTQIVVKRPEKTGDVVVAAFAALTGGRSGFGVILCGHGELCLAFVNGAAGSHPSKRRRQ